MTADGDPTSETIDRAGEENGKLLSELRGEKTRQTGRALWTEVTITVLWTRYEAPKLRITGTASGPIRNPG